MTKPWLHQSADVRRPTRPGFAPINSSTLDTEEHSPTEDLVPSCIYCERTLLWVNKELQISLPQFPPRTPIVFPLRASSALGFSDSVSDNLRFPTSLDSHLTFAAVPGGASSWNLLVPYTIFRSFKVPWDRSCLAKGKREKRKNVGKTGFLQTNKQ